MMYIFYALIAAFEIGNYYPYFLAHQAIIVTRAALFVMN
jgi:hypothetical protein